mmetsp:Transcript_32307/g.65267  ORF Transcript_32307/g.65267 Transcript_32307/m.65267 type:complete len:223 (-) Transcript_32307:785-1453(-)
MHSTSAARAEPGVTRCGRCEARLDQRHRVAMWGRDRKSARTRRRHGRQRSVQKLASPRGLVLRRVHQVDARVASRLAAGPMLVLLIAHEVGVLAAGLLGAVAASGGAVRAGRQRGPRAARLRRARGGRRLLAQPCAHEGPGLREVARRPAARGAGAGLQRGARLALVADGPVRVRDVVVAEEVKPVLRLLQVQGPVARRVAGAPLRREDRHAVGQGARDPVP